MHIIDFYILDYNNVGRNFWNFINLFESFIRFAVPIFFMLSGALLLRNYTEKPLRFYKKRFIKIIIPYIIFSIILSCGNQLIQTGSISLGMLWSNIINFNAHYHLWFFEPLILLYILVPILRKLICYLQTNSKNAYLNIGICIYFGAILIIPNLLALFNNNFTYGYPTILIYLGYFLLGYILNFTYKGILKLNNSTIIILYLISVILTSLGNLICLDTNTGVYNNFFIMPYSITIFIEAICIFSLFCKLNLTAENRFKNVITTISASSLYIYILHPLIIFIAQTILNIDLFSGILIRKCFFVITLVILLTLILSIITNFIFSAFYKLTSSNADKV